MSNPVLVKRSNVPGKVPTLVQLAAGELGINTNDAKLFFSTGAAVVEVAKKSDIPSNIGTVTSVAMTVPTGLTVSGSPITTTGTLDLTLTAGYSIPTTVSQANWNTAYANYQQWNGGATGLVAATGRTSLGATTVGSNLFTATNPGTISFIRANADNSVSFLAAAEFRTAIGAGTGSGTVTSVASLTLGTAGTDLGSSVANGTTTPVITLNVPTASASNRGALSAADWTTFNGKQADLGFTPANAALIGAVSGIAQLDSSGKVPATQLPSYVDDVVEAANLASFPATGEAGKIYVASDTNKTYRWSGSAYVYITSGAVDSVAGKTGVVTLVKADVGLANVDNTSDANKPVSTLQAAADAAAQAAAIAASTPIAHVGTGGAAHANVVAAGAAGFMTGADKTKLDGIAAGATAYTLPIATTTVLGGVKQGSNVTIDAAGVISVASPTTSLDFSAITNTPTTSSGYGITDALALGSTAAAALGTAAAGTATDAAHSDHVHAMPDVDALSNVAITSKSTGDLLQWNGTDWQNSTTTPSSASGVLSTWIAAGGGRYYADFNHNIGTTDVVITLYNNATNAVVQAQSIVCTSGTTVRVTVFGDSIAVKIVVVANGLAVGSTNGIANGGGLPVVIQDLYANRPAASVVGRLFIAHDTRVIYRDTGTSWDVISASSGVIRTLSYFANSVDSPNTADFAVNALAPVITDTTNTGLNVRSFSNTAEQGVSIQLPVPRGANNITFLIRGRAATAPISAAVIRHRFYTRQMPNNTAMGAWSAGTSFTDFAVPTNAFFQEVTRTFSLASVGMSVGNTYQLELTRLNTGVTNNLAYAWLMSELTVVFE